MQRLIQSLMHSRVHPPMRSPMRSLEHSLMHPPMHSLMHSLEHSLSHSSRHSLMHLPTPTSICLPVRPEARRAASTGRPTDTPHARIPTRSIDATQRAFGAAHQDF